MQITECFWQIHLPKSNPCCIAWSRQQVILAAIWMQTKQITYVFMKKETLNGCSQKPVDKFTYLGSSISSTENDINVWLVKAWTVIHRLSIIWKSNQSSKIKCNFFQAIVVSILLYGCIPWTLTKCIVKKRDGNCTRMLRAILNKSWKQHPI